MFRALGRLLGRREDPRKVRLEQLLAEWRVSNAKEIQLRSEPGAWRCRWFDSAGHPHEEICRLPADEGWVFKFMDTVHRLNDESRGARKKRKA
jgi:hypothetical protein